MLIIFGIISLAYAVTVGIRIMMLKVAWFYVNYITLALMVGNLSSVIQAMV